MSYEDAFDQIATTTKCGKHFVVLTEVQEYYGGPEEGGWWGHDYIPIKFAAYGSLEEAEAVAKRVQSLAEKLNRQAYRSWGDDCARECEWLDARGLDSDYLPEPDGPNRYYVDVLDHIPQPKYGDRYYS
jgi:hypothetical protein